jgi:hypothetical protein
MAITKRAKGQTTIYKKLKFEQHEPHYEPGVNRDVLGRLAVPAPLLTLVVLVSNGTNLI